MVDESPRDREQADVLAGRICAAASLSARSECQLLELIGEFDDIGAIRWWLDVKSLAHWLSWTCSMTAGTAREHVRVARAMRRMPTVTAAFREGRLSYSKVREVTRVVGVLNDAQLCAMALTATASQLARMLRAYRSTIGSRIDQERRRAMSWVEREDGMVDLRIRLPKEEAAVMLAAVSAAKDQFGGPPQPDRSGPDQAGSNREREQVDASPRYGNADAILDVARSFLAAAPRDRSGEDRTLVVLHVAAEQLVAGAGTPAGYAPRPAPQPAATFPAATFSLERRTRRVTSRVWAGSSLRRRPESPATPTWWRPWSGPGGRYWRWVAAGGWCRVASGGR